MNDAWRVMSMLRFESYKLYKSLIVLVAVDRDRNLFLTAYVEPIDHVVKSRYSSFEGPATKDSLR